MFFRDFMQKYRPAYAPAGTAAASHANAAKRDTSSTENHIPFAERPSCTIQEATQATGLSRTTLYEKIALGELSTKTVGRRRLVNVPSLLVLVGAADTFEKSTSS
ncbi:MAG: hypothetical protein KGL35_21890 [Bradyrhizobium sp.]|nr:hypothetical protein [Bradyrhizobium sp.]